MVMRPLPFVWPYAVLFWMAFYWASIVSFAVYVYRMNVEERALLTAIGEPYRAFLATRKRLIPFVY